MDGELMTGNKSLRSADKTKVDKFYTQFSDIEKEMQYTPEARHRMQSDIFQNQVVRRTGL